MNAMKAEHHFGVSNGCRPQKPCRSRWTIRSVLTYTLFLAIFIRGISGLGEGYATEAGPYRSEAEWIKDKTAEIQLLQSSIDTWVDAWRRRDLDEFMGHYSPEFSSDQLGYDGWRRKKSRIFNRPGTVVLEISNLWMFIQAQRAGVRFTQAYHTANYSDTGEKHLEFVKSKDGWRIVSELWTPLTSPKK